MSMFGPMQDELFKYRKRKKGAIDGSVQGIPYARYRRLATPPFGSSVRVSGVPHDLYLDDFPQEYRPSIHSPAVRQNEYIQEDEWEPVDGHILQQKLFKPFPDIPQIEEKFDYNKAKRANEIFSEIMQRVYEEREASAPVDSEQLGGLETELMIEGKYTKEQLSHLFDITDALNILKKNLPGDHPDVANLRRAVLEMVNHPECFPAPEDFGTEDRSSNLGSGNPYENDDILLMQSEYDLQRGDFREDAFGTPDTLISQQSPVFDEGMHHDFEAFSLPDSFGPPSGLEQVVDQGFSQYGSQQDGMEIFETEAEFISAMDAFGLNEPGGYPAEDEIEQAIDQIKQEQIPDPWQMQDDPFHQNGMFGPFGMPGPS